jgi:hypothetical protein
MAHRILAEWLFSHRAALLDRHGEKLNQQFPGKHDDVGNITRRFGQPMTQARAQATCRSRPSSSHSRKEVTAGELPFGRQCKAASPVLADADLQPCFFAFVSASNGMSSEVLQRSSPGGIPKR